MWNRKFWIKICQLSVRWESSFCYWNEVILNRGLLALTLIITILSLMYCSNRLLCLIASRQLSSGFSPSIIIWNLSGYFLLIIIALKNLKKKWFLLQKVSIWIDALFVLYLCRSCWSNVRCCVCDRSQKKLEEYHHNISRLLFFVLYSSTILPC